ncbi:DUF721 domain-containing protein [Neisseriaceae bacterium TC5R-5]|nr:DUF721 domain-containing protein [Neisseriaceae bacterium TC5R-5]
MMTEQTRPDPDKGEPSLAQAKSPAQQLLLLDEAFKALLPDTMLAEACQVMRLHKEELVVYADNDAIAGRLRVIAHGILSALSKQGYVAKTIRIKVNLRTAARKP